MYTLIGLPEDYLSSFKIYKYGIPLIFIILLKNLYPLQVY